MRTNLKVPFAEKEAAKKLGARWDPARKIWYVETKMDLSPFAKWSPTPDDGAGEPPKTTAPTKQRQSAGLVIVGSDYVEHVRVCDCLPWDVCGKCQSTALQKATSTK